MWLSRWSHFYLYSDRDWHRSECEFSLPLCICPKFPAHFTIVGLHYLSQRGWHQWPESCDAAKAPCSAEMKQNGGHLTSSRSISSPSVFGALQLCHCADQTFKCHVWSPVEQTSPFIHSSRPRVDERGWWQIKCLHMHLNHPNAPLHPPLCAFSLFKLIFLRFGVRQARGRTPTLGSWRTETWMPGSRILSGEMGFYSWNVVEVEGAEGYWLGMKKIGRTGSLWCQGPLARYPAGLQIWQKEGCNWK